jgi:flagellar M-ring protein FliF
VEKPLQLLGVEFDKSDLMRLAETGMVGVLVLVGLLFVVRPTLLGLTATPTDGPSETRQIGSEGVPMLTSTSVPGGSIGQSLPAGAGMLALSYAQSSAGNDDFVTVANIEGQLRASSIRRLGTMVDKDPDATLSIIRGWIVAEQN